MKSTTIERLYQKFVEKPGLYHLGHIGIATWYHGSRFMMSYDNAPALVANEDGTLRVITERGKEIAPKLEMVISGSMA